MAGTQNWNYRTQFYFSGQQRFYDFGADQLQKKSQNFVYLANDRAQRTTLRRPFGSNKRHFSDLRRVKQKALFFELGQEQKAGKH